jgi:hypothetical protein
MQGTAGLRTPTDLQPSSAGRRSIPSSSRSYTRGSGTVASRRADAELSGRRAEPGLRQIRFAKITRVGVIDTLQTSHATCGK